MLALATAASAVFTASTRIFNHDIMGCTADGVRGNHLYSGRVLGMTEPGDVAVIDKPSGVEYLAIECNPRFNGASYPTAIAHKLGIEHWLARVFNTDLRSLASVDLTGLEYDASRGEGVILVNWGPILVGKLLFLLAGPPSAQERLALELQARL